MGQWSHSRGPSVPDLEDVISRQLVLMPVAAVGAAAALAATQLGFIPVGGAAGDGPPPPPPVVAMAPRVVVPHDDGLHRFIVTPTEDGGVAVEEAPQTEAEATDDDLDSTAWVVAKDRIVEAGLEPTLVFENGRPGYLDRSGNFVAVDDLVQPTDPAGDPAGSAPATTAAEASLGHPAIDALARTEGVVRVTPIGDGSFAVVASDPSVVDDPALSAIDDIPVTFADDPYEPYQWLLDNTGTNLDGVTSIAQTEDADVDGREANTIATGAGIVVAVVDSGVDFSHPDLAGRSWVNTDDDCGNGIDDDNNGYIDDCRGWDFAANDNQPFTAGHHPHGTHVAGIIAATADNGIGVAGLAPEVAIMDLSVSATGTISTSAIARAIRYAVDNDADVVNLSLGSSPGVPEAAVQPMVDAVRYAEANDVLLVIAAGNDNAYLDAAPVWPASVDAVNVLTVGASSPSDTKAGFSNHGSAVDVFAPGELILSTVPGAGYQFMSGTSQAAPTTAAAAALVLGLDPTMSADAVIDHLVGTGDYVDALASFTPSSMRLNAGRAVGADVGAGITPGPGEVVIVQGLAAAGPDGVDATITVDASDALYDEPHQWAASLVTVRPDGVYAIVDHVVSLDGADLVTDDRGAVGLGAERTLSARLSTALPDGDYALVVEAVTDADPEVRLGDAFVVAFSVGVPVGPEPDTDPDAGSPSPTPTPSPGGSSPSPAPSPSPGGGGSPAPAPAPSPSPGGGSPSPGGGSPSPSPSPSPGGGSPSPTPSPSPGGGSSPSPSPSPGGGGTPSPSPSPSPGGGGSPAPAPSPSPSPGGGSPSPGGGSPSPSPSPSPGGGSPSPSPSPVGGSPSPSPSPSPTPTPTPDPGPETPTGPVDVVNGEWSVTSVSPRSGFVGMENFVTLTGTFPADANVWFGNQPGTVYVQASTWIVVATPVVTTPSTVDLAVRTRNGEEQLRVADAYAFQPVPTVPGAPGGANPSPAPAPGGGGSPSPSPTPDPGTDPTPSPSPTPDPGADTDPGPGAGGEEPEVDRSTEPQERARPLGPVETLDTGLSARPIEGLDAIRSVGRCTIDPCRPSRIGG